MVHAGACQAAGAHIGEEDVSVGGKLADDILAFFGGCVDDDGFLAAIVEVKDRIVLIVGADRAKEIPDRVAARWFDLDDLCAPVRQDAACTRRSHVGRVFDDFQSFEHSSIPVPFINFLARGWTLGTEKGRAEPLDERGDAGLERRDAVRQSEFEVGQLVESFLQGFAPT